MTDPFHRRRNIARTLSHSQVFEYINDRLRVAYQYYGIPQTPSGPLFTDVDQQHLETRLQEKMRHMGEEDEDRGRSKGGPPKADRKSKENPATESPRPEGESMRKSGRNPPRLEMEFRENPARESPRPEGKSPGDHARPEGGLAPVKVMQGHTGEAICDGENSGAKTVEAAEISGIEGQIRVANQNEDEEQVANVQKECDCDSRDNVVSVWGDLDTDLVTHSAPPSKITPLPVVENEGKTVGKQEGEEKAAVIPGSDLCICSNKEEEFNFLVDRYVSDLIQNVLKKLTCDEVQHSEDVESLSALFRNICLDTEDSRSSQSKSTEGSTQQDGVCPYSADGNNDLEITQRDSITVHDSKVVNSEVSDRLSTAMDLGPDKPSEVRDRSAKAKERDDGSSLFDESLLADLKQETLCFSFTARDLVDGKVCILSM